MTELTLHDYQIVARDYLRGRGCAALFLDMGLGKTASALAALEPRHLPALVVAPKKVAEEVWDVEAAKWRPDLRVVVAMGSPDARAAALARDADITVIGQDNLRDVLSLPSRRRPFRTLIVDELSGYKSRESVRWKTGRRIIKSLEHVWGLTGTPSPNGYLDLWAQIYLLDGGERLGRSITGYRDRFFLAKNQLPSGVVTEWEIREGAQDRINSLIEDICLAMETEGRVQLPESTFNLIDVTLPPKVKTAYREMRDNLVVDLEDVFGGEIHTAESAAILSGKLAQMSAGFLYVDDQDLRGGAYTELHSAKMDALAEILTYVDSPVLVFYRFIAEADRIKARWPQARDVREPGAVKDWNAGRIPIMLAHPASAGHGLNLQFGGHTAVWMSLPWSLEHWQQSNKRLARQGQTHPVVTHVLIGKGTVDRDIYRALQDKTAVQAALLSHLESPV